MTAEHHHDERLLAAHARALADGLSDVLDIEAGLSEVLLQSRHTALAEDAGQALDVDAGLSAILPSPSPSPDADADADRASNTGLDPAPPTPTANRKAVPAPPVAERLEVRSSPAIAVATRALLHIAQHAEMFGDGEGHALDLVDILVPVIDVALARAKDDQFAAALGAARERALAPDLTADRFLADDVRLGASLARARNLLPIFAATDWTGRPDATSDHQQRLNDLRLLTDLATLMTRADRLFAKLANQARSAVRQVRCLEAQRLVGLSTTSVLGPPVDKLLDDFTLADLRRTDLRHADLTGLRWSENGTQWPPSFDLADLRSRSDESPPGSGVYVVRGDSATVSGYVEP